MAAHDRMRTADTGNRLDRIGLRPIHGIRRAKLARLFELVVVDVHGDDSARARDPRALDGRQADAAAAEDGDRLAGAHLRRVDGGADAGHHAAAH